MKFFTSLFRSKKEIIAPTESSISSLAPKVLTKPEDIEKIQPYLNKLKETIDAKDVNNIALTGSYGSGKSTILKTFKALNPQYKFLNVSLAAFNQKEGKLEEPEKEKLERLLEVSILQQIFYHVKPEKIPESRFKRIINRKWWHYLLLAVAFIIWVISTILLIKYDYLDKLNPESWNKNKPFSWYGLLFIFISFSGIGFLAKLVLQLFSNSKINKVNIKGELELGENANKSVFNEHLEEILYFFERTDYNVVIIEDLDRFDNTDIFTKLREINILLNNSKLIDQEINFIYAVGDNLIKDKKERVKFFEYIIPVIPFINSSNAREQLQTLIKEAGLKEDIFSREFMSDVVTFIDDIDMRLLINIFHEFVIYRHALKAEFVTKPEELFAMITYKNIEPEDFSLLNNRQGKLYMFIHNKKEYIKEFIDTVDKDIKEKENRIDEVKKHSIENIKELRKVYIYHVLEKLPPDSTIEQSIDTLINDEEFQKVIDGELSYYRFEHRYNNQYFLSGSRTLSYNFSDIEKQVNINYNYETRLKLIEGKGENQIQVLQAEISKLRTHKANIESWELKQIFDKVDLNQYLEDFSNNALLRNLIINGYINENYNDYISLFHEGSVTREDLVFERNVKSGTPNEYTYKLHKIDGLLERIDFRYFGRDGILNFDLVDYLAKNYNTYKPQFDSIIILLSNERDRSIKFIDEYVADQNRPIDLFINKLTKQWENFFYYVTEESKYHQKEDIDNYLRLILTYADLEDILKQHRDPLIEMITYNPNFLSLVETRGNKDLANKVTAVLKELDIKFNTLTDPDEQTENLFRYVYQHNHYRINKDNVLQMLQINTNESDVNIFNTKNYEAILTSGCSHLIEYINNNINDYVTAVHTNIETNTQEDEKYLIELFNKKNIKAHNSKLISDRMEATISNISAINDDKLIFYLLEISKIEPTWGNLHHIYSGYDNVLKGMADFINSSNNASVLSNIPIPRDKNEEGKMTYIQMWKDLLASPYLSDESFEKILRSSNIEIKIFDFENTAKERLEIMVQKRSFAFNNDIFDKLEEADTLGLLYLESYKEKVLEFPENFEFEEQHFTVILKSESYSADDINSILNEYDVTGWDSDSFLSNLQDRLANEKNIEIDTAKIIQSIDQYLNDDLNVKILNNYFERFKKHELREIIMLLKNKEYHKYLSEDLQESLQLEQSSYNDALFGLMIDHNYISSKSKPMKKGGFRIFKNKDTDRL